VDPISGESDSLVTGWAVVNSNASNPIEYRRLTLDTYQLRSVSHIITIPKEGFDIFKASITDDRYKEIWNGWLLDNDIDSVPRDDLNG
jgi:hypothetical protein